MTRTKSTFLALIAVLLSPMAANADILTFDEDPCLVTWGGGSLNDGFSIPSLTDTSGAATCAFQLQAGSAYSGEGAMFNFNSREARLVRSSVFDLVGAYFMNDPRVSWGPSTFEVFGYDAVGDLLYQSVETITDTWTFITLDMFGISDFRFNPLDPNVQNMMMDNLVYNNVPEPGTLALLTIGLFGMGMARRRKKA